MNTELELIFQCEEQGIEAEKITVFDRPLEKGEEQEVCEGRILLHNICRGDVYSYKLETQGCYIVTGTVLFSGEDLEEGRRVIRYSMEKRAAGCCEAFAVSRWTEPVENRLFCNEELSGTDLSLNTPFFASDRKGKGSHQFTSPGEASAWLKDLCAASPFLRLFFLDEEEHCPAVVCTKENLKACKTAEDFARVLKDSSRLNVLYQAQVHGNEPASGEGALAVAAALAENPELTEKLNLVMIPYVNRSGTEQFSRWENETLDLNRDALLLRSPATAAVHRIFSRIMPEVFIDGHEFSGRKRQVKLTEGGYVLDSLDDVLLSCLDHLNREPEIFPAENRIMLQTLTQLREKGFRSFVYPGSWAANTSCGYARMMNTLAFLVETNGIKRGAQNFRRRVVSQRETVMLLLSACAARHKELKDLVRTARCSLAEKGSTYNEENCFVLAHETRTDESFVMERKGFGFDGTPLKEGRVQKVFNRAEPVRSRPKPTAYILSRGACETDHAGRILTANGAECFELKPGAAAKVVDAAGRLSERVFAKGAWVFAMDQPAANVIAASLEPDLGDVSERNGSFVQAGILKEEQVFRSFEDCPGKNLRKGIKSGKNPERRNRY